MGKHQVHRTNLPVTVHRRVAQKESRHRESQVHKPETKQKIFTGYGGPRNPKPMAMAPQTT